MPWSETDYQTALKRFEGEQDPTKRTKLQAAIRRYEQLSDQARGQVVPSAGPKFDPATEHTSEPKSTVGQRIDELSKLGKLGKAASDPDRSASGLAAFDATPPRYSPGNAVTDRLRMKYFIEPSVEEFKTAMGDKLGPKIDAMTEKSPEYQRFADLKWAEEYEKAKAEERPVSRLAYTDSRLDSALGNLQGAATSFSLGAADTATAGIATGGGGRLAEAVGDESLSRQNQARVRGEFPFASTAGEVAGYLTPSGLPSLGARALTRGVKKALPKLEGAGAKNAAGRGVAATGVGATVAAGESGVSDLASGDVGFDEASDRALLAAALGGPVGLGAHALGGVAGRSAVKTLRRPGVREVVGPAEESGIAFGPLMGARIPKSAETAIDRSMAGPGRGADAVGDTIEELKGPLARGAYKGQQETLPALDQRVEKYYQATEAQGIKVPAAETGKAVLEVLEGRTLPQGGARPFAQRLPEIRRRVPELFDVRPAGSANGIPLDQQRAARLGLDDLLTGPDGQPVASVTLVPKRLSARELDAVIGDLDDLGKAAEGAPADPMYEKFMARARADRDLLPANEVAPPTTEYTLKNGQKVTGWSALKAEHDRIRSDVTTRNVRGGLPREVPGPPGAQEVEEAFPDLKPNEQLAFEAKIRRYAETGGDAEAAKSLRQFAAFEKIAPELRTLRAVALQPKAETLAPTGGLSLRGSEGGVTPIAGISGLLEQASVRSLPLRVALAGDEGYGGAFSPQLKWVLQKMRGNRGLPEEQSRRLFGDAAGYQARSPNLSGLALRGGRVGAVAGAANEDEPETEELTDEDWQNLQLLLESVPQ